MPLTAGTRVGFYEVIAPIGQGGMGEVYRARDTRLGREVALKVLSDTFGSEPDRLARFEREAKTLAALNHPHIAQIYGVEETPAAGSPGGARVALIMELVDGEDLSVRVDRGALPVDSAVAIARQIVDALDAAHARGIVHRDLKPANIKVRPDGTVKVLDFGLAKDAGPAVTPSGQSTMTSPAAMTEYGSILGTPGYMSPEQATGQNVDHRTDIWSFGCVLYEMLSGRRPFKGETSVETIASVIKSDPDWSAIVSTPPALQTLVRRCLKKDVRQRLHHIADVRIWLEEISSAANTTHDVRPARRSLGLLLTVGALALALGAAGMLAALRWHPPAKPGVVRMQITPPADAPFTPRPTGTNLAISPDGSTIVYHAEIGDSFQLVRRRLDAVEFTPIPGTEGALNPSFSPDGQRLAFFSGGRIKTIPITGGSPTVVCEANIFQAFPAWLNDSEIVFTQALAGAGLMRVRATGGTPEQIIAPDAAKDELLFFGADVWPGGAIVTNVSPMDEKARKLRFSVLVPGAKAFQQLKGIGIAKYLGGRLVYASDGAMKVAPFSLERMELTGDAMTVEAHPSNELAMAANGTYVYLSNDAAPPEKPSVVLASADGRPDRTVAKDVVLARQVRISPDGRRLALTSGGLNYGAVWIHDLHGSGQPVKLTFGGSANYPTWSPDGRTLFFQAAGPGPVGLFSVPADGSVAEPKKWLDGPGFIPEDWSPDGRLLYQALSTKTGADLMLLDLKTNKTEPWLQTQVNEVEARVSPDRKTVAYVSDQTTRYEVFVRAFASGGPTIRVSSDGGHDPRWSADGRQLYFQSAGRIMVSTIDPRTLNPTPPRVVVDGGFVPYNTTWRRTFDVTPDGRVLLIKRTQPRPNVSLIAVLHALDR